MHLKNLDCDTGKPTQPGEYALSDETHAKLVGKLTEPDFDQLSPELRENLLRYFEHADASIPGRKGRKTWMRARRKLEPLRTARSGVVSGSE